MISPVRGVCASLDLLSVRLLRCAFGSVAHCVRFLLVRSLRSLIAFVMGGFLASPVRVEHFGESASFLEVGWALVALCEAFQGVLWSVVEPWRAF